MEVVPVMVTDKQAPKPPKRKRSVFFWWTRYVWPVARHLIIPAVCLLVLFAGMAAGYTVLGGGSLSEVWELDTWKHMFDLIFAET